MVRAILDGRKTQTRRIVKPQPNRDFVIQGVAHLTIGMDPADDGRVWYDTDCIEAGRAFRCPYGEEGDRLWVRETFGLRANWCLNDQKRWLNDEGFRASFPNRLRYRADAPEGNFCWRPSIHMPRWASRITLEIASVRVERLRDISERDCIAEGIGSPITRDCKKPLFRSLWQSINGAESWDANPWVWVVEFRKLEGGDA